MVIANQRLAQEIAKWIRAEQQVGKEVTDQEISHHFHIPLHEAREIYEDVLNGKL